jgi:hypothetical protein
VHLSDANSATAPCVAAAYMHSLALFRKIRPLNRAAYIFCGSLVDKSLFQPTIRIFSVTNYVFFAQSINALFSIP